MLYVNTKRSSWLNISIFNIHPKLKDFTINVHEQYDAIRITPLGDRKEGENVRGWQEGRGTG